MHQDSLYFHTYTSGYIALSEKNCPFVIDDFFKYLTLSLYIYGCVWGFCSDIMTYPYS